MGRTKPRGARLHDRGARPLPSSGNEPYTEGNVMPVSPQWRFDRFQLDPDHACLWCEAQAITLPPKAFALLHYLVTHPDRLQSVSYDFALFLLSNRVLGALLF